MSPGTRGRARRHGAPVRPPCRLQPTRCFGGCTFAEDPERTAPDARIIWHADFDPGALRVTAVPASPDDPDAIDPAALQRWLAIATDADGEHAVLSDGWRRVRLDIGSGSFAAGVPVMLHYHLRGIASAEAKLLPLRRLLALCRHRQFAVSLFLPDAQVTRQLLALRVHDALAEGASQREIAAGLFGAGAGTGAGADSLRSRVRRLVREARRMAAGRWRGLMRRER